MHCGSRNSPSPPRPLPTTTPTAPLGRDYGSRHAPAPLATAGRAGSRSPAAPPAPPPARVETPCGPAQRSFGEPPFREQVAGESSLRGRTRGRVVVVPSPPLPRRCRPRHADLREDPHGENHHSRGEPPPPRPPHRAAPAGEGRVSLCPAEARPPARARGGGGRAGLAASRPRTAAAAAGPRPPSSGFPCCPVCCSAAAVGPAGAFWATEMSGYAEKAGPAAARGLGAPRLPGLPGAGCPVRGRAGRTFRP